MRPHALLLYAQLFVRQLVGVNGAGVGSSITPTTSSTAPPDLHHISTRLARPLKSSASVQICAKEKGRCHGKQRSLRQVALPDAGFGPGAFPLPVDWDGDGDVDLLWGRASGDLVYTENVMGTVELSAPIGVAKSSREGACEQSWSYNGKHCQHWCCHEAANSSDVCLLQGTGVLGRCERSTAWGVAADSGLIPVTVDWDGDSLLDLVIASCNGSLQFWRRESISNVTRDLGHPIERIVVAGGGCLYPWISDFDSDGDQDLLLGRESGVIDYYENVNGALQMLSGEFNPLFKVRVEGHAVPVATDWDGDGATDLIVGSSEGSLQYFGRTEHGALVYTGALEDIQVPSHSVPRVIDWDGDGLKDLLLASSQTGELWLWISQVEQGATEQAGQANPFSGLRVSRLSVPQVVDWNSDGQLGLLVGQGSGDIELFQTRSDGTLKLTQDNPFRGISSSGPVAQHAVDFDGDGDYDLLLGHKGEVLFFERENVDRLRPGTPLSLPSGSNQTYLIPYAVDWDADGDLDLLLGDSGEVLPWSIRLHGFPLSEWNTVFMQSEGANALIIGGRAAFISVSQVWILAYCSSGGFWFIFTHTRASVQATLTGACNYALAKRLGSYLLDRSTEGVTGQWQIHGSASTYASVPLGATGVSPVTSDGSAGKPHCARCSSRTGVETCRSCAPDDAFREECARELCVAQGFGTGAPVSLTPEPASACSSDGQNATNESLLTSFIVEAQCFNMDLWQVDQHGHVAEILPRVGDLPQGSVRYFERTSSDSLNGLEERVGAANPFGNISVSSQPYPFVVDWNGDGHKDLILGSASQQLATLASAGTAALPHCAFTGGSGQCSWDTAAQGACARGLCRAAGFATGIFVSGGSFCHSAASALPLFAFDAAADAVVQGPQELYSSLTALCMQGGAVRYFQNEGGGLVERLGRLNPFDEIVSPEAAVACVVDWDGDNEYEVVVGDNSGGIRYFEQGRPCELESPCSGRGLCHAVLGTCECVRGHILGDCSRCEPSFYSLPNSEASVARCAACPGLSTSEGLCAGRGTCSDDSSAAAGTSNSSLAFGTGNCSCSEHFHGTDGQGRSTCSSGACPPGSQLQHSGRTSACAPCRPGSAKSATGNHLCEACPEGRFSLEGATECSACPGGRHQALTGQGSCQLCFPGSFSGNASSNCTPCPIGHFGNAEMTDCQTCAPGSWSSITGASACTPCTAGSFSLGTHECQQCAVGRYSDSSAASVCGICNPGRWSGDEPGATGCAQCQPGSFGTGDAPCELCPVGSEADDPGEPSCNACRPGKWSGDSPGAVECEDCEAGWYGPGDRACAACSIGTYSPEEAMSDCISCEPGRWSSQVGATHCGACLAGEFSNGSHACQQCAVGHFSSSPGSSDCSPCAPGTWSGDSQGATECRRCEAGWFGSGREKCRPCADGSYSPQPASRACLACEAGKWTGSSGANSCRECPAGWFGNGSAACEACPVGTYSEASGLTSCTACLPGTWSGDEPGATACTPCRAGWHGPGTEACQACAVGKFSEEAGMVNCSVCEAGSWSGTTPGATQCELCRTGRFSSGAHECLPCERGGYTEYLGMSECTLCKPGTYSLTREASLRDVCLKCDFGTFSTLFGAASAEQCEECEFGTTTVDKGAWAASVCIRPDPGGHWSCVAGQECEIEITGNRLQEGHHVGILKGGSFLEGGQLLEDVGISDDSDDGNEYEWEEALVLDGGVYDLGWCPNIHFDCDESDDYEFWVGKITIVGPVSMPFTCIRGRPCRNLGPVTGLGLSAEDKAQVQTKCGSGEFVSITDVEESILLDFNASEGTIVVGFEGITSIEPSEVDYQVCWCAGGHECDDGEEGFHAVLSPLRIEGPSARHEIPCYVGQPCIMRGIGGNGLAKGDRLMILENCDGEAIPIAGIPGGGIAETVDGSTFAFLLLNDTEESKVLRSMPGIFRLCFCRPEEGKEGSCTVPQDFRADAGLFQAKGPFSDHRGGCFLGADCELTGIRGVGLKGGDEVLVADRGNAVCGRYVQTDPLGVGKHPAGLPVLPTQAVSGGTKFGLGGLPSQAIPGAYPLCWRPKFSLPEDLFGAPMGTLMVTCPAGTYRLQDSCQECPLGSYCLGGTQGGDYQDDVRQSCPSGTTTVARSSTSQLDCLCEAGLAKNAEGICTPCSPGRYKPQISNNASCPELCPPGTTSLSGASRAEHCFREDVPGLHRDGLADVFVLEGYMVLPRSLVCGDQTRSLQLQLLLRSTVAASLGVSLAEVELTAPCGTEAGNGTRRLSSETSVFYRILRASLAETSRLEATVNIAEIQGLLADEGLAVSFVAPPVVSKELLNCSAKGLGKAFPLGSRPTSVEQCTCTVGFMDVGGGACRPCGKGSFKSGIGGQPCVPCGVVKGVALTTLGEGATSEEMCTCPRGFFTKAGPADCGACGVGYYCSGGASKEACPKGSTTAKEKSGGYADCVCMAGYFPLAQRNATERCAPCASGFYKSGVLDAECSERCRPNSDSEMGATSSSDCFCKPGFYYANASNTCESCPAEGVECPGGFDPPGGRRHAEPKSLVGFYMTGLASAEECIIEGASGSVCLAGAKASNQSLACKGSQTGLLCGACEHLTARDLGDMECKRCDAGYSNTMHVLGLVADLITKAGFGIFLGKQAIESVSKARRMDAIILRILLQWITVCSVLSAFDFSGVAVYDWSKEAMIEAQKARSSSATADNTATGLIFKFQFPEWFMPVWRNMMAVSGSIPSPMSPQESMECLVQQQVEPTADGLPSLPQLLAPALYWLVYPALVMVFVFLICLALAKVIHPVLVWSLERCKKKMTKLLCAAGVSAVTAAAIVECIKLDQVLEILQDPGGFLSVQGLVAMCGVELMAEALGDVLCKRASEKIVNVLGRVVSSERLDEDLSKSIEEALSSGESSLGPIVKAAISVVDLEALGDAFSNPLAIPELFLTAIPGSAAAFASAVERFALAGTTYTTTDRLTLLAAAQTSFSEVIPGKHKEEHRVIFGLFRSSAALVVLRDAFPLYIVTLYSIWGEVTKRMMGLIQVKRILVTVSDDLFESQVQEGRWLYDMRFRVLTGEHFFVGIIGIVGLAVWSVGFLLALYGKLHVNRHRLQEHHILVNFGFFYNGLEPHNYWWDVVTKKCDILCLYLVSFTEVFHDPRAKLIMYLGFAGIFWAAHNIFQPFDDRQNQLADRLEGDGLTVRFVTLFVLQCMLVLNAGPLTNVVIAIFLIVINAWFLITAVFILLVEIAGASDEFTKDETRKHLADKGAKKAANMMNVKSGNPVRQLLLKIGRVTVGLLIKPIIAMVFKVASVLSRKRGRVAHEVPHILWNGAGKNFVVLSPARSGKGCYCDFLSAWMQRLYHLQEEDQRAFLAHVIGEFLDHVLTTSECQQLPSCILDIFFALPAALRDEKGELEPGPLPFHIRVAKRISTASPFEMGEGRAAFGLCKSECTQAALSEPSKFEMGQQLPPTASSAEDLNTALIFVQHLSSVEVWEFLEEANRHRKPAEPLSQEKTDKSVVSTKEGDQEDACCEVLQELAQEEDTGTGSMSPVKMSL